jgi:predicted small lipoprotein YifL
MRLLTLAFIIVFLSVFLISGCGKKGPPTLKEIKAGVMNESTY